MRNWKWKNNDADAKKDKIKMKWHFTQNEWKTWNEWIMLQELQSGNNFISTQVQSNVIFIEMHDILSLVACCSWQLFKFTIDKIHWNRFLIAIAVFFPFAYEKPPFFGQFGCKVAGMNYCDTSRNQRVWVRIICLFKIIALLPNNHNIKWDLYATYLGIIEHNKSLLL